MNVAGKIREVTEDFGNLKDTFVKILKEATLLIKTETDIFANRVLSNKREKEGVAERKYVRK